MVLLLEPLYKRRLPLLTVWITLAYRATDGMKTPQLTCSLQSA